jgi:hypothetical protein
VVAATVIEPDPFVIDMPVPAVKVAAVGVPPVFPMISWPFVIAAQETTPDELVTKDAEFVVLVARNASTPVPNPETPVLIGSPVQLVNVPEFGTPNIGVTKVGEVAKTKAPEPVLVVATALAKFALVGVPRKVATLAPNPETPVLIGNPVHVVSVPLVGVPKIGVMKVGEVEPTKFPVPVCPIKPVLTALFVAMLFPYATVIFP